MGLIWGETLTWPPSGNHLVKTGYQARTHYPSEAYVEWDRINLAIIAGFPMVGIIDYQVHLRLIFRPPSKRKYDLDNRTKAVQDLLVKALVIKDDDSRILNPVHLEGVPHVKGEPGRVIVEIYSL